MALPPPLAVFCQVSARRLPLYSTIPLKLNRIIAMKAQTLSWEK